MKSLFLLFCALLLVSSTHAEDANPYRCEGTAQEAGRLLSLHEMKVKADDFAKRTDAISLCTAAELYKRLGDPSAAEYYEKAIDASRDEPTFELFYADFLRLYRGAAQQPLFPQAEAHLFSALDKLRRLVPNPTA